MFSFGIEPSMTRTNGASSVPSTAWRNGSRNSPPPSVGDSTLLCRWTFGMPGIAPSSTSSMPGWPAAVMETESPSQLIPSEIQRMWTSCTPGGVLGSVAMEHHPVRRHLLLLQLQRVHVELLAPRDLDVEPAAAGAAQREVAEWAVGTACPAHASGLNHVHPQRRVLGLRAGR